MSTATTCNGSSVTLSGTDLIIKGEDGIEVTLSPEAGPNGEEVYVVSLIGGPIGESDCCECVLEVTSGCDFPEGVAVGAIHYNGGNEGWLHKWDGTNWLRYCSDTCQVFKANYVGDECDGDCQERFFRIDECDAEAGVFNVTDVTSEMLSIPTVYTKAKLKEICDCVPYAVLAEKDKCPQVYRRLDADSPVASDVPVENGACWRWQRCPVRAGDVLFDDSNWFLPDEAINVQQAMDQLSDFLSTAFGDDLVILNNPTFYIRADTGSANPPINKQSDLTVGNAFNSFNAMKSFIQRTYIVGKVTIDARGTFDLGTDNLLIRPEDFKNSTKINVRGDPNNAEAFTIRSGFDIRTRRWSFRNCVSTIKDFTIEFGNVSEVDGGILNGVEAADGSTVSLLGTVKVKGLYNIDRNNSPGASVFRSKDGATMSLGVINERALRLIFSLNGASKFSEVFNASYGGKMSFLPLDVVVNNNFNANFLFTASSNGTMLFNGDYLAPIELTTFSGAGRIAVTNSASLNKQSYIEMFGVPLFYGGDGPNWINTAWPFSAGGRKIRIDKYSLFMNSYGTDLTADTDFVVV